MKRLLFLLALALCLPATAQIPQEEEDLMELYGASEEYREMQRQMQDYLDREARAEQKRETTRTLMLVLSLAVAVVPLCSIGKKIIEEAGEVWMAAEYEGKERTAEEISQLLYHLQVMMIDRGIALDDVYRYL